MNRTISKMLFTVIILSIFISISSTIASASDLQAGNTTNDSFNKAKKILERNIYNESEHQIDIYCGCQYDQKKQVDFDSCGYRPERDNSADRSD